MWRASSSTLSPFHCDDLSVRFQAAVRDDRDAVVPSDTTSASLKACVGVAGDLLAGWLGAASRPCDRSSSRDHVRQHFVIDLDRADGVAG